MVPTVIAVPQQVQDIWLQKWWKISFSSKGQVPNLEAAFQVKALDVEAVSVGPPDEGVLQIRHDLLPGELSLSGMFFSQNDSPDCPLHAEVPLKVFHISLRQSPVSNSPLTLTPSRTSPLPLVFHLDGSNLYQGSLSWFDQCPVWAER